MRDGRPRSGGRWSSRETTQCVLCVVPATGPRGLGGPWGQEERWLGAEKTPKALTLSPWGWPRPPDSLWSVSNHSGAPNEATSGGRDRETWGNWG